MIRQCSECKKVWNPPCVSMLGKDVRHKPGTWMLRELTAFEQCNVTHGICDACREMKSAEIQARRSSSAKATADKLQLERELTAKAFLGG